jgi:cell division protein FtsX
VAALIVVVPGGGTTGTPPTAGTSPSATTLLAYIRDSATITEVGHLRGTLARLRQEGRVTSFRYESKAQALADLRARLKDPSILDDLRANPLPASFVVRLASTAQREAVVRALASDPAIDGRLGVVLMP